MLTASLLETIISAGSIVRPTPRLEECAASASIGVEGGGCAWTAAPRQVRATRAVKVNDRMLRQTLCSSLALKCSFCEGPVGGCCPQVVDAVAENVPVRLVNYFSQQVLHVLCLQVDPQTCTEMNKDLQLMHCAFFESPYTALTATEAEHLNRFMLQVRRHLMFQWIACNIRPTQSSIVKQKPLHSNKNNLYQVLDWCEWSEVQKIINSGFSHSEKTSYTVIPLISLRSCVTQTINHTCISDRVILCFLTEMNL